MIHKTTRSILSVLLAALLLVTSTPLTPAFADGGVVPLQAESGEGRAPTGSGTKENPYQIATANDLREFAQRVNNGQIRADADAVLTDDEQLALGRLLREERRLNRFYGTEGLYGEYTDSDEGESFTVGLRGEVTGVVEPAELTVPEVQGLSRLEPFGAGNPLPLFEIDGARLERIQPLSGGKHLRLGLSKDGTAFQALLFGTGPDQFGYLPGDLLDLVVTAEISVYREVKSVALKVEDLRLHGVDQEAVCYQRRIYENALGGEHRPEEDALICPTREDAAVVYRYLNRHGGFAGDADLLWQRLMGSGIGYGRLLVVLDAMEEQGLITREAGGFRVLPVSQKVDLMNAAAICRLRGTI